MNKIGKLFFYETPKGKVNINVLFKDDDIWMTQKAITQLFETSKSNVSEHISKIFNDGELKEDSTVRDFRTVQNEGNRNVERNIDFYNLDMIISVGYKINSKNAIDFRKWATTILKEYTKKGFVLNDERLKQTKSNYFKELLERIKEIRVSEKMLYQQLKDIYILAKDYDKKSLNSIIFFANVQNKVHYAIAGKTAGEIIYSRVNHKKENMGLTNWQGKRITKLDVIIAKNYLQKEELKDLKDIIVMFLDFAEYKARKEKEILTTDWMVELDRFLDYHKLKILEGKGSISKLLANKKALQEYRIYRNAILEKENQMKDIELKNDIKLLEKKIKEMSEET